MPGKPKKGTTRKHKIGKASKPIELELPSTDDDGEHNCCLVKRPGPQGLVAAGIIDGIDTLTGIAGSHAATDPKKSVEEMLKDPAKLKAAMDLIDKVVVHCVVDPDVQFPPTDGSPRDPEVTYVDDVDPEDKMFILQWVLGGTHDWEAFRRETQQSLGDLAAQ